MRLVLRRCLVVLATAHLILVTIGAAKVNHVGPIGAIFEDYGQISGSASGFGFFAPDVSGQFVLYVDIIDAQGQQTTTSLGTGSNREVFLRVASLASQFRNDKPLRRREFATSLATKMFERHPQAREITLRVEGFDSVSMQEFKDGQRAQSLPFYKARFKSPASANGGS